MWGKSPEELDPSVTGRVPVHISYDDRHFTNPIQVMPKYGYTKIFEKMLNHKKIEVQLNTDALDRIKLEKGKIFFDGVEFQGRLSIQVQMMSK
jgi:UDP-galactopyranose mutase